MLTPDEYAALADILQRHVAGRLSPAEALALNSILAKLAPPEREHATNGTRPPVHVEENQLERSTS